MSMDERATRTLQFMFRYGRPASEVFGKLADGRPVPEQADYSHMERAIAAMASSPEFNRLIGLEPGSFWSIKTGPDSRVTVEVSRVFNSKVNYLGALTHKVYSCTRQEWFQTKEATLVTRAGQPVDSEHHRRSKMVDNLKEPSGVLGMPDEEEVYEAGTIPIVDKLERVEEAQKYEWVDMTEFLRLIAEPPSKEYGLTDLPELLGQVLDAVSGEKATGVVLKLPEHLAVTVRGRVNRVKAYDVAERLRRLLMNKPTDPEIPDLIKQLQRATNYDATQYALALING